MALGRVVDEKNRYSFLRTQFMNSSYSHLARFSSPGELPKKGAIVRDRLALLFDRFSELNTEVTGRVSGHLAYVESLLRMRSTRHLDDTQRLNRELLLDLLVVYASGRSYPQGLLQKEEDMPCYVDDQGRFCPVGFLLARTAGHLFAVKVCTARSAEELPEDLRARLDQWIEASGFSREELSLLQPKFPAIMADQFSPEQDAQHGMHPKFAGLQNDSQAFQGDYLAKTFIGSEAGALPVEAQDPGGIVVASVFGPNADAVMGEPRLLAFHFSRGVASELDMTFSRTY